MSWLVEDAALSFEQGSPLPTRSAGAGCWAPCGPRRAAVGGRCTQVQHSHVTYRGRYGGSEKS